MSLANVKLSSDDLEKLKELTGEKTAQKAVEKAIFYFMRSVRQRKIIEVIQSVDFDSSFDVVKARKRDR